MLCKKKNQFILLIALTTLFVATFSAAKAAQDYSNVISSTEMLCATNGALELYVNAENGDFWVSEGDLKYCSNSPLASEDNIAIDSYKGILKSQLVLQYSNKDGRIKDTVNSFTHSVKKDGLTVYKTSNGFVSLYDFPAIGMTVPLQIALTKDGFTATVLVQDIIYKKQTNILTAVSLLPNFNSASSSDEGFMLIPENNGSLVYLNNGKSALGEYITPLYGTDYSIKQRKLALRETPAIFPVFGLSTQNSSSLGIITKGDSVAEVRCSVSGLTTSFNMVYPYFNLRAFDSFAVRDNNGALRENILVDNKELSLEALQCQYFLSKKADYNEMAAEYKNYLVEQQGLASIGETQSPAVYLDLYGAVRKTLPVLGVPVDTVVQLTSYKQAAEIASEMQQITGVQQVIRLLNATDDMLKKQEPKGNPYFSKLGTKSDFLALQQQQQHNLFIEIDPVNNNKGLFKFYEYDRLAKDLMSLPSYRYDYNLATGQPDESGRWTISTPEIAAENAINASASFKKNSQSSVYLAHMGERLYSDFGNGTNREATQKLFTDSVKTVYSNNTRVMLQSPFAYLWGYSDKMVHFTRASLSGSIVDEQIPFMQLALAGMRSYSTYPINLSSSYTYDVMKAIETGSSINFSFTAAPTSTLKNSVLNGNYSSEYESWKETIKEIKQKYGEYLFEKSMVPQKHEVLQQGVYKVTYQGGDVLYFNYNSHRATANGKSIDAMSVLK